MGEELRDHIFIEDIANICTQMILEEELNH